MIHSRKGLVYKGTSEVSYVTINGVVMSSCSDELLSLSANDGKTLAFWRFIKAPDPNLYSFDFDFGWRLRFKFQSPVSSEKVLKYAFS